LSDSDEEGRNKAVQKAEKRRKESREKLLGHLKNNCHGYYTHEILERVNEKIKDLMVELAAENAAMEKDEQKIKQLEKQISEEVKAEVE
ncbi:21976_t:CDS:1, partial [Racocetra persica]